MQTPTHLSGCVTRLLGSSETSNVESYTPFIRAVVEGASAIGLENIRHAKLANGSHYIGVANTLQYTNVLVMWQTSSDSRVPVNVGIGYGSSVDETICLMDWSKSWRPKLDADIIDAAVRDYLADTPERVKIAANQLRTERESPTTMAECERELIRGVREGYLLSSRLERSIAYLDEREQAIRYDNRKSDPVTPLSLYDLRVAMLRTLPSEGKKDSINAVILRSPLIHCRMSQVSG